MSMSYHIDGRQQCIFVELYGDLRDWEFGVELQRLWADPAFDASFSRFIDASAVTSVSIQPALLDAVVHDVQPKMKGKLALVAILQPMRELFKNYQAKLIGVPSQLFIDKEEALEWLQVTPAPALLCE